MENIEIEIEVCDIPVATRKVKTERVGKYDHIFENLTEGQCLKLEPKKLNNVRQALIKYLKKKGYMDQVKVVTRRNMGDDFGRIWVTAKETTPVEEQD